MTKTNSETRLRKRIMLGAGLILPFGLPFAVASRAFADPTPKFAYVANYGDDTVSAYTINSATGALRAVAGSPFVTGSNPASVTVDPLGRFAYVATFDQVYVYTINSSTGALRAVGSPVAAGNTSYSVAVDPLGRFAYVANAGDNTVSGYTINRSTGALRAVSGSPFTAGSDPNTLTVDPSGQFVYVVNQCGSSPDCSAGDVSAYAINSSTGALRAVAGSPFAAGKASSSVTVVPSGRFAYVTNFADNTVSAYAINRSTGALSELAGSPFAAMGPQGMGPQSVTVDPSGQFAYVAKGCLALGGCLKSTVSAFTINSSTGALSAVAGSPFAAGNGANQVTVDPSGQFAYVANQCLNSSNCSAGSVSAYTINTSTGALSAVAGSPFVAGNFPFSVAVADQAVTTSLLTLAPRSLAFGNLPITSSSAAQSVTVTNTSSNAAAITGIALRGKAPKQFAFTDDCGKSLAAHATCTLKAMFRPTTKGAKTAFLDVNGGGGGRSVMLTGTGT